MFVKNQNRDQKSKCWSKIKIEIKNRNFGLKFKFWGKLKS